MNKVIEIVNKSWFKAACCGGISVALFINGSINYAFFAAGFGVREFLLSFKKQLNTKTIITNPSQDGFFYAYTIFINKHNYEIFKKML